MKFYIRYEVRTCNNLFKYKLKCNNMCYVQDKTKILFFVNKNKDCVPLFE